MPKIDTTALKNALSTVQATYSNIAAAAGKKDDANQRAKSLAETLDVFNADKVHEATLADSQARLVGPSVDAMIEKWNGELAENYVPALVREIRATQSALKEASAAAQKAFQEDWTTVLRALYPAPAALPAVIFGMSPINPGVPCDHNGSVGMLAMSYDRGQLPSQHESHDQNAIAKAQEIIALADNWKEYQKGTARELVKKLI